jgi:hypothetical protein
MGGAIPLVRDRVTPVRPCLLPLYRDEPGPCLPVQTPGGYRWSSFLANAGETQDRMLVPHPEFLALGNEAASRQAAYKQLFADEMPQELLGDIRDSTNGGYPLGSDSFKDSIERMTGRATERRKPGRPRGNLPGSDGETKEIGL